MGFKKTPSEVYANAWAGYQSRCLNEGYVALNQYCRSIGLRTQRLYEWLRRRKISVSDFQNRCVSSPGLLPSPDAEIGFREVEVRPQVADTCGSSETKGDVIIELRSGDVIRMSGLSIRELTNLMMTLNRASDVGA